MGGCECRWVGFDGWVRVQVGTHDGVVVEDHGLGHDLALIREWVEKGQANEGGLKKKGPMRRCCHCCCDDQRRAAQCRAGARGSSARSVACPLLRRASLGGGDGARTAGRAVLPRAHAPSDEMYRSACGKAKRRRPDHCTTRAMKSRPRTASTDQVQQNFERRQRAASAIPGAAGSQSAAAPPPPQQESGSNRRCAGTQQAGREGNRGDAEPPPALTRLPGDGIGVRRLERARSLLEEGLDSRGLGVDGLHEVGALGELRRGG